LEILRLYPELFFEGLRPEHLFYPGRNGGSFYIYWMMLPPVQRIRHPILFEEMITMQILLITGTTSSHSADIQVRAQCPYRELLYILKEFFRSTGMASWSEISQRIVEDKVVDHEVMKMHLCPADLGPTDLGLLKATCASQEGLLDYVLHRLILYDWFADLGVEEMLPDAAYQLVITPGKSIPRPWDRFHGVFHGHLQRYKFSIGQQRVQVTADAAPNYMAYILSEMMRRYDDEHVLGRNTAIDWFNARPGYVKKRPDFELSTVPVELADGDVEVLCTAAAQVTQVAENLCTSDSKW